jgi:hypothetical protein
MNDQLRRDPGAAHLARLKEQIAKAEARRQAGAKAGGQL